MSLSLYQEDVLAKYKSQSQRIRVMSEHWFTKRMYCPACSSDTLKAFPNNSPVVDFLCPECEEHYQLKSQSKFFGGRITDGAYGKMMESIESGRLPNFFFLHYDPAKYSVTNLLIVPNFFFSSSIIEARKPLNDSARRAGWVGCNILFSNLAEEGKIKVIEKGSYIPQEEVRNSWRRISFLKDKKDKSWSNDILWCIDKLGKSDREHRHNILVHSERARINLG